MLVLNQARNQTMEICDSKQDLLNYQKSKKIKTLLNSNQDPILCNHCKRTANNDIRCLGKCVADNDY